MCNPPYFWTPPLPFVWPVFLSDFNSIFCFFIWRLTIMGRCSGCSFGLGAEKCIMYRFCWGSFHALIWEVIWHLGRMYIAATMLFKSSLDWKCTCLLIAFIFLHRQVKRVWNEAPHTSHCNPPKKKSHPFHSSNPLCDILWLGNNYDKFSVGGNDYCWCQSTANLLPVIDKV